MADNTINFSINKRVFNDVYFPHLFGYQHRFNFYFGSAGSGKSVFICQKLIIKALKEKRRVLVVRQVATSLRNSVYQLFKETLIAFNIADQCRIVDSLLYIELPNGSEFLFMGLDDEMKLLSIQNISDVFVEEATETSKDIIDQLNLRMRGQASNHQIHLAFNPVATSNFMYEYMEVNPPRNSFMLKTTYKDNKFLTKEYVEALEDMRRTNPRKARVYCDGEWGVMGLLVFDGNWEIKEFDMKEKLREGLMPRFGGDFGFTLDPSTVIPTLYNVEKEEIWVFDEIYQRGLTNPDLKDKIKYKNWHKQQIYFDSADPKSIAELKKLGVKARGASKGRESIKYGLAFLNRHKIYVSPNCVNLISELNGYQYVKDKQTGQYQMDKLTGDDHAIDALRYAYSEYYTSAKFKSMSKTKFGI